jgi:hypothetical protein
MCMGRVAMSAEHQRHDGSGLTGLESLGDTEQLRADALAELPAGADTRPPPRQVTTDPTGSIRVTVDAHGRVVEVEVRRGWSARLGAEELPSVIFQTYMSAAQQAAHAFAQAALAAEVAAPEPAADPAEPAGLRLPPDSWDQLTAIRQKLRDTRAALDRLAAIRSAGAGTADRTYIGAHGCLTAIIHGTAVVGLTGDARRIQQTDAAQLGHEALEVFSAARPPDGDG